MGLNSASSGIDEKPALPTRETIAGGVLLLKEQPSWLAKKDQYRLYLAVEELVDAGYNIDEVLNAIGITRALYYGRLWFTDEQAADMAATLVPPVVEEKNEREVKNGRTAREKIALIDEVNTVRYEKNILIHEACRWVGITTRQYFRWETDRRDLIERMNDPDVVVEHVSPRVSKTRRSRGEGHISEAKPEKLRPGRRPRAEFVEITPEALEERKRIVEEVREKTRKGMSHITALRTSHLRAKTYRAWIKQIEQEARKEQKELLNPDELYAEFTQGRISKDEFQRRLIKRYMPFVEWKAHDYAIKTMHDCGAQVDEDELISHGLFEGIVEHMYGFNTDRGIQFSSFISQKICQRMIDGRRQQDRFTRNQRAGAQVTLENQDLFYVEHGRPPYNDDELYEYLVSRALANSTDTTAIPPIVHLPALKSMDAPPNRTELDRDWNLHHLIGHLDPQLAETDEQMLADYILSSCTESEKHMLTEHYLHGKTLREIGQDDHLSQARESQMHSQVIKEVRMKLCHDENVPRLFLQQEITGEI